MAHEDNESAVVSLLNVWHSSEKFLCDAPVRGNGFDCDQEMEPRLFAEKEVYVLPDVIKECPGVD
jgi:hypothetical protein